MNAAGLTQEALADRYTEVTGQSLSQPAVGRWCDGSSKPAEWRWPALAEILGNGLTPEDIGAARGADTVAKLNGPTIEETEKSIAEAEVMRARAQAAMDAARDQITEARKELSRLRREEKKRNNTKGR